MVNNLITEQSSSLEGAVLSISIFNVIPRARNFVIHHKYFSTASVFTTEHFVTEIWSPVLPHNVTKNMQQDFFTVPRWLFKLLTENTHNGQNLSRKIRNDNKFSEVLRIQNLNMTKVSFLKFYKILNCLFS